MASVFLFGFILEKKSFGMNSLGLSGGVLVSAQPFLIYDIGFQLSFVCVFFILWRARPLALVFRRIMPGWLAEGWSVSICAWLGSLGLIVYYFDMVTPIGLLVNVCILPMMSLILVFGLGLLGTAHFWPFAAFALSGCLKLSLNFLVAVIFLFDQCPGSYFFIKNINHWHVLTYYIILIVVWKAVFHGSPIDKQSQLC